MNEHSESTKERDQSTTPSKMFTFITGLILFGGIFSPAGVFLFYNLKIYQKITIGMMPVLTLGCITGLIIATIPAYIFTFLAFKKLKQKKIVE